MNVSSVSPVSGLTFGRTLVTITGAGFDVEEPHEVKFGTIAALNVRVLSASKIDCFSPIGDSGTVDVTVKNLTTAEQVTKAAAYQYKRIDLAADSVFLRASFALIRELTRQVLKDEVYIRAHPRWTADVEDEAAGQLPALPNIVLRGPSALENRDEQQDAAQTSDEVADTFSRWREPVAYDLEFDLEVRDDSLQRMHNLEAALVRFFEMNRTIVVPDSRAAPDGAGMRRDLVLREGFRSGRPTKAEEELGIAVARASCVIRAIIVDVGELSDAGTLVGPEDVQITTEQI